MVPVDDDDDELLLPNCWPMPDGGGGGMLSRIFLSNALRSALLRDVLEVLELALVPVVESLVESVAAVVPVVALPVVVEPELEELPVPYAFRLAIN